MAEFINGTSYDPALVAADATPIIRISNITDPAAPYLTTTQKLPDRFLVNKGDLLVSWSASFKSTIWGGPTGWLNQHIFNVRERPGYDRHFIRHAIEAVFDELQGQVVGLGMMHLRRSAFLTRQLPNPPLSSQRAVAEFLDQIETSGSMPDAPLPADLTGARRRIEWANAVFQGLRAATDLRQSIGADASRLLINVTMRPDLKDVEKHSHGWRRRPLGDVLVQSSEPVKVEPDATYRNVGIYSFGRGLFEKPAIDGARTSAKTLFRVRTGWFVYSRLFAFEGAYAVVPADVDGAYVSNEYPTFQCDSDHILPEFLGAYFQNPHVWDEVAINSRGLGDRRQRVQPRDLLAYQIELPPIETQMRSLGVARELTRLGRVHRNTESETVALTSRVFHSL